MRKYLKNLAVLACVLFAVGGIAPAYADDICKVSATWTPPTHYAKDGICDDQTQPIGAETVEYTVMWRVKGTSGWTNVETLAPTVELTNLPFDTTIEMMIGSHYPGGQVLCYSAISEITTASQPAPGACSNINLTTGF